MIITIDGPAGTGKTTIAQQVAGRLGYQYFDTGAMYRALTYQILQKGISLKDQASLKSLLDAFKFDIKSENSEKRYFVQDQDVTTLIRSPEVTGKVSEVSAHPEVRKALVAIQREYGKAKNSVFEGRDMGTIVFPKAEVKIFLTARPAVRAERRYLELKGRDEKILESEVMKQLLDRDNFDSTREISPLQQAEDSLLIDTSDLTIDQVTDRIIALVQKKQ